MKMPRLVLAAALILLVAAAVGASAQSLLSSSSAEQLFVQQSVEWTPPAARSLGCGLFCSMAFGGTTPTEQTSGSTCSNAETALGNELRQIAGNSCSAQNNTSKCNVVITYTAACTETAGVWKVSGYATYNCLDQTC